MMGDTAIRGADRIESPQFYGMDIYDFLRRLDKPLRKGDRVELIPVKNGVKIIHVKREEVKP